MLYTQWNYDEAVSVEREEAYEDGREAGKAEGIIEGERQVIYNFLEHLGKIPEDIRRSIEDEQDGEILKKWCMAAPGEKALRNFERACK